MGKGGGIRDGGRGSRGEEGSREAAELVRGEMKGGGGRLREEDGTRRGGRGEGDGSGRRESRGEEGSKGREGSSRAS